MRCALFAEKPSVVPIKQGPDTHRINKELLILVASGLLWSQEESQVVVLIPKGFSKQVSKIDGSSCSDGFDSRVVHRVESDG